MRSQYEELRQLVNHGEVESVSQQLRLLRGTPEGRMLQDLIGARLALRAGQLSLNADHVLCDPQWSPFFQAEANLIKGFISYHQDAFTQGILCFLRAEALFLSEGLKDRALIAAFNAFSGKINAEQIDHEEQLRTLVLLQRRAFEIGDLKTKALLHRQKSYALTELDRIWAAHKEIRENLELLEMYTTKADFDLGLAQAAYCRWRMGANDDAKSYLQRIIEPIDERVKFAIAFVDGCLKNQSVDATPFEIIPPYWRGLSQRHDDGKNKLESSLIWDRKNEQLHCPGLPMATTLRSSGMDGRLITLLACGRTSKVLLCEKLWPDDCETQILDNRLHRLISRTNKKFGDIIVFDGQRYSLRFPLVLK